MIERNTNMSELKRNLVFEDIVIYDKEIEFSKDDRKAGYNIGNLLNMPYLSGQWNQCPHNDEVALKRMNLVADLCKDSILYYYCLDRPENEKVPYVPRIVDSVKKYLDHPSFKEKKELLEMVKDEKCLCVHIRSGDLNVEEDYVQIIEKLSHKFEKVILLGGIHLDEYFKDHHRKTVDFVNQMNMILNKNTNIYVYLDKPDHHLCIMHLAANLLVHKGGFSCLGSLICSGKLYVTSRFEFANHPNWIENTGKRKYYLCHF